jgi:uncharacterized membrane protein YecN with MAPEG domain
MLKITAISAAILTFIFVKLAFNVIALRRKNKISIGFGDNQDLARAIRAHGNFSEYSPLALILIACLEINGCWWFVLLPLATMFIAGRVIHALGISKNETEFKQRILGMKLTFSSLIFLAVTNLLMVFL